MKLRRGISVPSALPVRTSAYYTLYVSQGVDWSERGDYMQRRHGITPAEANETLSDPDRLVLDPDPASKSGRGTRTIGYSPTAESLITVILLTHDGTTYGVNGWRSNSIDQRRYRGGRP